MNIDYNNFGTYVSRDAKGVSQEQRLVGEYGVHVVSEGQLGRIGEFYHRCNLDDVLMRCLPDYREP